MVNSVYEKCMENPRKGMDIKLVPIDRMTCCYIIEPNFKDCIFYFNHFMSIHMYTFG
jgi:hypothetical protein